MKQLPILYSFRRCPYAIRSRMAILYGKKNIYLREISLKNKPQCLLDISPKGTVPVLDLGKSTIHESLEIMLWALNTHSNFTLTEEEQIDNDKLIQLNDTDFKKYLDLYKYADKNDPNQESYLNEITVFLNHLEHQLYTRNFLIRNNVSLCDLAIFPFIRQFVGINTEWFQNQPYPRLQKWLNYFLTSSTFEICMKKQPLYAPNTIDYPYPD